jgi:hypothetical protein
LVYVNGILRVELAFAAAEMSYHVERIDLRTGNREWLADTTGGTTYAILAPDRRDWLFALRRADA